MTHLSASNCGVALDVYSYCNTTIRMLTSASLTRPCSSMLLLMLRFSLSIASSLRRAASCCARWTSTAERAPEIATVKAGYCDRAGKRANDAKKGKGARKGAISTQRNAGA